MSEDEFTKAVLKGVLDKNKENYSTEYPCMVKGCDGKVLISNGSVLLEPAFCPKCGQIYGVQIQRKKFMVEELPNRELPIASSGSCEED